MMASTMKQADTKVGVPLAAQGSRVSRRSYAPAFKREVVARCLQPGASVSGIALSHGINANVIRKWLPRYGAAGSSEVATMLPVLLTPAARPPTPKHARIHAALGATRPPIELSLGAATVRLPAGFDAAELRSIVQILSALP